MGGVNHLQPVVHHLEPVVQEVSASEKTGASSVQGASGAQSSVADATHNDIGMAVCWNLGFGPPPEASGSGS
jgi:hypothetical protein